MNQPDIRSLSFVLTAHCNLACRYCYQNKKRRLRMEWETLRAALDLALQSPHPEIELLFSGGEPLLEFGLIRRAVSYVRRACPENKLVHYMINTNGTLIDRKIARFLADQRFETQLSFDGIAAAQDIRSKGTFAMLDRLLHRLQHHEAEWARESLRVAITLVSDAIPYLADSFEYLLRKGVRGIAISPLFTHDPGWEISSIQALDDQYSRIYQLCKTHYKRTGEVPLTAFRKRSGSSRKISRDQTMCNAPSGASLTVDADGELFGCMALVESCQEILEPFLGRCLDSMHIGGIAQDTPLSQRLIAYQKAAKTTELFTFKNKKYSSYHRCDQCRYVHCCRVCPVSIGHIPGNEDPNRIPDYQCAYNRISNKYRERFPRQTDCLDLLRGNAMIPELMRELRHIANFQDEKKHKRM